MKISKKIYSIVNDMNSMEKEAMIEIDLESRNLRLSNRKNEYSESKIINETKKIVSDSVFATGKRKVSIAKVWMQSGNGEILVNGETLDKWLDKHEILKNKIRLPLEVTGQLGNISIKASTLGGGYTAQVGALKDGIINALIEFEPTFREVLKSEGLFTNDSRFNNRRRMHKKM